MAEESIPTSELTDFQIILSSIQKDDYPENTACNFTVTFDPPLDLKGKEICLAEFYLLGSDAEIPEICFACIDCIATVTHYDRVKFPMLRTLKDGEVVGDDTFKRCVGTLLDTLTFYLLDVNLKPLTAEHVKGRALALLCVRSALL